MENYWLQFFEVGLIWLIMSGYATEHNTIQVAQNNNNFDNNLNVKDPQITLSTHDIDQPLNAKVDWFTWPFMTALFAWPTASPVFVLLGQALHTRAARSFPAFTFIFTANWWIRSATKPPNQIDDI